MARALACALFLAALTNNFHVSFVTELNVQADNCTATCRNGECIYEEWLCDNQADCSDGSDEMNCGNETCGLGHFLCMDSGNCIPDVWKCNGAFDCPDGEDERDCKEDPCADQFQCRDRRRCIAFKWKCDSEPDCDDGSDEEGCGELVCPEFKCSSGRCIKSSWRCDGDKDCHDGSDEANCTHDDADECEPNGFRCDSGECINKAWKCDGDADCLDRSDEDAFTCSIYVCRPDQFSCADNKTCIPKYLKCDTIVDCLDGSDEAECSAGASCREDQFDCTGNGDDCLDVRLLCNRHEDCRGGEDEAEDVCSSRDCTGHRNNCSHSCVIVHGRPLCSCPHGMQISKDNTTCEDINECLHPSICSHICVNKADGHGYKCICHPGYEMDRKTHRCKAAHEEPVLLFANRHDVREIRLRTGSYKSVVENLHSAIAIDYDYADQFIYWSDVTEETISRVSMNGSSLKRLVSGDINTPDGLALDWIHKNLYWTDTGKNQIEVVSLRNPNTHPWRMVLVDDKLDEPRAIVVDPRPGRWYLFWSDWGTSPKIERSQLDGSDRRVIVSKDIFWPNGLTVDYETDRIYWIDAQCHSIFSANYDGLDRHLILTSAAFIRHPFAMTFFEDEVFWTDWGTGSIHKVPNYIAPHKARNEVTPIAIRLHSPMGILVYHRLRQPIVEDICRAANCQQLCLPRNGQRPGARNFTCACSGRAGFRLAPDGRSCVASGSRPKSVQSASVQLSRSRTDHSPATPPAKHSRATQRPPLEAADHHHVETIGFIICTFITLFIILLLAGLFLYRFYKRKIPKVLNFDNPVYRRTTDDTLVLQRNHKPLLLSPSPLLQPLTGGQNQI